MKYDLRPSLYVASPRSASRRKQPRATAIYHVNGRRHRVSSGRGAICRLMKGTQDHNIAVRSVLAFGGEHQFVRPATRFGMPVRCAYYSYQWRWRFRTRTYKTSRRLPPRTRAGNHRCRRIRKSNPGDIRQRFNIAIPRIHHCFSKNLS